MNKLNKTTIIGLLVFTMLLGIGLATWLGGSKKEEDNQSQDQQELTQTATSLPQGETAPEVGAIYEEENTEPIIQISEDTLRKSKAQSPNLEDPNGLQIPSGFGISEDGNTPNSQTTQAQKGLEEMAVELETPSEIGPAQNAITTSGDVSEAPDSSIEALDPRDVGITANDGPEQNYEETALTVQRTLTAVNSEGEKQLIRMKIPVMYKSRTLRLEGDTKKKAVEILDRLREKSRQLSQMKKELDADLLDWNNLVKAATPYDSLLPESPTLPQNQSAGGLNRENNPEMSAGKSISYEIVPKEENKD